MTVFESTPPHPAADRLSRSTQITQFYSTPTVIRLLRRVGAHHVENHDLGSLRVLDPLSEPINPEAWNCYNEYVGQEQCAIVDIFWQTETGSITVTLFPGAIETKPGSATVPFFSIEPAILDSVSGKQPWPSIAWSVSNDHNRYLETYMKPYPGLFYTGDGATHDEHGYIWIKGRIDDVINVSGHRLSAAEVESALIMHKGVAETTVIGTTDELTGQAVFAFATLKPEFAYDSNDEAFLGV
ncbi:acetyl-CoA synthetase-like protein [Rhizopogon salebrosus TDB-379]|nr:acetyl-CoA synthetase-like protein [Rhizopogon salebrosus TDB-379]